MTDASYTRLRKGAVARTIEASLMMHVDLNAEGQVLGVEVIGDGDWRDALVRLVADGRLLVLPGTP